MQLSIQQVARLIHTSPRTVLRRRAAGELPEGELTEDALKQLPLLHAGQAARIVRRSAATIRRWRAAGRLRGVRTGEVWRYSLADLEAASQPLVSTPGEEEGRAGVEAIGVEQRYSPLTTHAELRARMRREVSRGT